MAATGLASLVLALSASPASAHPSSDISGINPELQAIAERQSSNIAAHLPGYSLKRFHLAAGWATGTVKTAGSLTLDKVNGNESSAGPICQLPVDKSAVEPLPQETKEEIIAHEVFHCYEHEIEPAFVGHEGDWIIEGLARWVDLTLFPNTTFNLALKALREYYGRPGESVFDRSYSAVGFWAHASDVLLGQLWQRIPAILKAGLNFNNRAAFLAAVSNEASFLQSWGSSAFDVPFETTNWLMGSPLAGRYYPSGATPQEVNGTAGFNLVPYSTAQLVLNKRLDKPLVRIYLQPDTHGRFGVQENYLDGEITEKLFCSASNPEECACPKGDTSTLPPTTPLPKDADLGVAAGTGRGQVQIEYFSPQGSADCKAPPKPPAGGGSWGPADEELEAGDYGDPHMQGFGGFGFSFQGAGEFTLLKSTIARDLEIQARLQPFNRSQTVTAASAVAIRVGRAIVEVDVGSGSNPLLYVNHRRTSANTLRLPGGASLQRGSVPYELGNPFKFPGVTVRWPDGTAIGVYSALGELSFWVEVAPDRVGHLTGLLGDAGVPAAQQFRGRDGTPYTYPRALQESGPLLYRFGASWRIKQRESLFTYARGKSTRSYTILHFPKLPFDEGVVPLAKAVHAETLCREAGITNQEVLQSCEYDILVTGNQHYAAADGLAQSILDPGPSGAPPPTTPPAPPAPSGPPVPTPIDLGAGGNPPAVAYDPVSGDTYVAWLNAAKSGVEVCTVPSGSSVCNHGAGPYQLSNSLAATAVNPLYENVRLVILPGGTVVAVAAVDGANQKVDPNPEYAGVTAGVFAWSSSAGGEHFGADNGEKLLASDQAGDGAMPGNGAVALSATQIGVYGNAYPFGSGFTDFSLKTPAPVPTPVPDVSGNYGDQADTTGGQLASVPGAGGKYIVVAVGGAPNPPSGCPAGPAIGYGEAVNTAPLLAKEPWGAQFFKPLACEAIAPVLAGGGPSGGSIGLLYEAGPGLSGAGADGIYYRSYSTAAMAFGGPVLVSEETSLTLLGAEQLSLSKDGGEGVYAAWNDSRGLVLAYSSNGGATWQPPVQTGLNSYPGFNAGSSVIAGIGGGQAAIAYAAGGQDYLDFFVY